jgi:hypothetical protein
MASELEQNTEEQRKPRRRYVIVKAANTKELQAYLDALNEDDEDSTGSYSIVKVVHDPDSRDEKWVVFLEADSFQKFS